MITHRAVAGMEGRVEKVGLTDPGDEAVDFGKAAEKFAKKSAMEVQDRFVVDGEFAFRIQELAPFGLDHTLGKARISASRSAVKRSSQTVSSGPGGGTSGRASNRRTVLMCLKHWAL